VFLIADGNDTRFQKAAKRKAVRIIEPLMLCEDVCIVHSFIHNHHPQETQPTQPQPKKTKRQMQKHAEITARVRKVSATISVSFDSCELLFVHCACEYRAPKASRPSSTIRNWRRTRKRRTARSRASKENTNSSRSRDTNDENKNCSKRSQFEGSAMS
jgi:hypothetical protein